MMLLGLAGGLALFLHVMTVLLLLPFTNLLAKLIVRVVGEGKPPEFSRDAVNLAEAADCLEAIADLVDREMISLHQRHAERGFVRVGTGLHRAGAEDAAVDILLCHDLHQLAVAAAG